MPRIVIDGQEMEAREGATVLECARELGIDIPTLCYHKALKPFGTCKLCVAEVKSATGSSALMLSCVLRVQEGLEVRTESGQVRAARQKAFDSLFRQAPEAPLIRKLALQYGYEIRRPEDYLGDDCVRCGLCLRVCKERIGPAALSFGRKDKVRIVELRAEGLCIGCGACVALCPTGVIKLEDDGETRVVSKNGLVFGSFSNVRCEACGRPCGPRACIDLVTARISGIPAARAGNVCPECLRVSAAEALTGTFPV